MSVAVLLQRRQETSSGTIYDSAPRAPVQNRTQIIIVVDNMLYLQPALSPSERSGWFLHWWHPLIILCPFELCNIRGVFLVPFYNIYPHAKCRISDAQPDTATAPLHSPFVPPVSLEAPATSGHHRKNHIFLYLSMTPVLMIALPSLTISSAPSSHRVLTSWYAFLHSLRDLLSAASV